MAGSGPGTGRFLHELPAWLMCSFCRLMDALGRADWERFGNCCKVGGTEAYWERLMGTGVSWEGPGNDW